MNDDANTNEHADEAYQPRSFAWLALPWFVFHILIFQLVPWKAAFLFHYSGFYLFLILVTCIQLVRGWTWDESWAESISRRKEPGWYWFTIACQCLFAVYMLGMAYSML